MARTISIGNQSFEEIREKGYFLVDKTDLIKEWWESADSVTLTARPRRFGKTINMVFMIQCLSSKESAKNKSDTMVLLLRERKC